MNESSPDIRKTELVGLSEALDNTGICTFMYFPKTKEISVPEKARNVYQCKEIYTNMPYSFAEDFVYPEDHEGFNAMYFRIDSGAETATFIFRNKELTAQCHVTLTVVTSDAKGNPEEVLGIIENESAEMNQAKEMNRLIEALSSDCFAVLEVDLIKDRIELRRALTGSISHITHYLDRNNSYSAYVRFNAENMVVEADKVRYAAEFDPQNVMDHLRIFKNYTIRYKRHLGSIVNNLEARFVDISDAHDGSCAVLAYRYIDDIIQAQEKEHRQDAIFRSLGNIFYTIYYVDMELGTYREITAETVIKPWFEPVGSVQQSLAILCDNLVSPPFQEEMRRFTDMSTLNERMRGKKTISTDYIGVVAHWIQATFVVNERDENGNLLKVLYVTRKIDEEKEKELSYQQELKDAAEEANRANRAKTDFLSRMSHDIRTPLNGIIGMTYLAQKEQNPDKTSDCLAKIDTSSKFLLGLVNDILDMTKAESGKLELHPELYSAKAFRSYLQSVVTPLCNEKNITFTIDDTTSHDIDVLVDTLRINQVYFNLLSNAVKFTPEGGTIQLRIQHERLSESRVRITSQIADSGIGISEEFQKVLFDPFTQENRIDRSETRGTGLGLAIVKKIMDAMGGTISVKSEINKGTTFTVCVEADYLPSAKKDMPAEAASPASDPYAGLSGKHILLCEDHPLNQEIAVFLLQEKNMAVEVAEDGKIGADKFQKSPIGYFDAILMDIRMPVMDGYEATAAIRSMDRSDAAAVPIIAMSADAFADDVKKCLEAGMNGHIAKPVDPVKMYRILQNHIKPS